MRGVGMREGEEAGRTFICDYPPLSREEVPVVAVSIRVVRVAARRPPDVQTT